MKRFLVENPLLVLGILGAVVTLFASITKAFAEKERARRVLLLAVIGFVILVLQQLIQYTQGQNQAMLDQNRKDTPGMFTRTISL
jgi:hypothetical protein